MVVLEPTQEGISKIIRLKLKKNVAPGQDGITVRELCENLDFFLPITTNILKQSFSKALVPLKMKMSYTTACV